MWVGKGRRGKEFEWDLYFQHVKPQGHKELHRLNTVSSQLPQSYSCQWGNTQAAILLQSYVLKSSRAARISGLNLQTFRSKLSPPIIRESQRALGDTEGFYCECCIWSHGLEASTEISKFITFQKKPTELYSLICNSISASKHPLHWKDTEQKLHPPPSPPCQPECFPRVTSMYAQHKIVLAGLYGSRGVW